jgi:hypothetical protein
MSTALTNQTASQALKGQDAIVSLNGTQSANLAALFIGQRAVVSTSGDQGYISAIDLYGTSFKVKPQYPSNYFCSYVSSNHIGILNAAETVTVFPQGQ